VPGSVTDTPAQTFSAVQVGLLRLQRSSDSLKLTMTSSADALKAHFESELLSLRSAVSQLEGRTGQAGCEPSSAAQPKAWAVDMYNIVNHVSAC